ncbi:MAG: type II secretion system F family protein [Bacillota bacterium]
MPFYEYRAAGRDGQVTFGRLEGDNVQHIAAKLREKGLFPINIAPFVESPRIELSSKARPQTTGKVPLKVLTLFCRQFAVMINAGVALMPCISILQKQTSSPRFAFILNEVRRSLESGESLAKSLSRHPKAFPSIMISMIEAGEAGGVLDRVLERVAEHFEKESALVQKVKSAMTYPIIVIVVAIGVTAALIMFVLPMFAEMFEGSGVALPWITRFLLGVSDMLTKYWYLFVIAMALIIVPTVLYVRTAQGRRNKDALLLNLPLFGPLTLKMVASRFSRTLSTLLSSGVPLMQCLEIVSRVVNNVIVGERLGEVTEQVRTGVPLGLSLEKCQLFPPMVVQMTAIGEETGSMDELLTKVADFYDQEVDIAVKNLTTAIEPAITLFLAGVVTVILLSVFLPMAQMMQVMG